MPRAAERGATIAPNGDQGQVLALVYRYDQLNRLRTARGLVGLGNTPSRRSVFSRAF